MFGEWEHFEGGPFKRNEDRVHVTLSLRSVILLNKGALEMLGQPEAVTLHFNKRKSMIGVKEAKTGDTGAFPLVDKGKVSHRLINAGSFCQHHKIKPSRTLAFYDVQRQNGYLALDLNRVTEIGLERKR